MKYGSICSGIEAATQAWHPLGWKPSFFSEIDPFPRAVLQHHYPDVPLHGDFTTIEANQYDSIDLLVGGTPCQSFSIAGLRGGLGDDRGNLALEYLRLADRLRPRWLVWENVPGVLSSLSHDAPDQSPPEIDLEGADGPEDGEEIVVPDEYESDESHALLCFLAGARELGYFGGFRILDAQYVRTLPFPWAVPQRRRRVFFVGYLGDWRRAAAVLFERESLQGHPAPRRKAGKTSPATAKPSADGSCAVAGCDREAKKRGWCNTHYQRWRKHGVVADAPVNEPGQPDHQRFWKKVSRGDNCWEWSAATNEKGYGIFWSNTEERTIRAHRFSYEEVNGEIPDGLEIDHLCRNPSCVRPEHLEAVTGAENTRRGNAGKHWAEKRGEFDVAPTISARTTGGGGLGTDVDLDGGLVPSHDVSQPLLAKGNDSQRLDAASYVAAVAPTLNAHFGDKMGLENQHIAAGGGCSFVPPASNPLTARMHKGINTTLDEGQTLIANGGVIDVAHTLPAEGFDASEDGTGRGVPIVAFDCKGTEVQTSESVAAPLRSMNHNASHQNAGGHSAVAIQERAVSENPGAGPDGAGVSEGGAAYTLEARENAQAVATPYSIMPMNSGKDYKARETDVAQPIMAGGSVGGNQGGDFIAQPWAVRRLTPTECERLMGFTDGFTDVPWRGKDHAPDGRRYKALGNSMAVNVMRWIGDRIALVDAIESAP